jgi:hypothetical protein
MGTRKILKGAGDIQKSLNQFLEDHQKDSDQSVDELKDAFYYMMFTQLFEELNRLRAERSKAPGNFDFCLN